MRKYFTNPDYSLTKFGVMMALAVAHLAALGYLIDNKSFRTWLANADWRWLSILVIALVAIGVIALLIETGTSKLRVYAALVVVLIAAVALTLNWETVTDAFSNKNAPASLIILGYLVVMSLLAHFMATSRPKSTTHTRGGA